MIKNWVCQTYITKIASKLRYTRISTILLEHINKGALRWEQYVHNMLCPYLYHIVKVFYKVML